jgi:hypothetical protein
MNLDQLIKGIREEVPEPAELEHAAARVKARLFPHAESAIPTGIIRSCADFVSLIPSHIAGTLEEGRKLLLEVHTHECVACRKALDLARHGARQPIEIRPRKAVTPPYARWAIAASVIALAGGAAYWGRHEYPALGGGPRATIDIVEGALYKVSNNALIPLGQGAELGENDAVRTAKNSTAVLRLNDGSRIEMNQRAQISVTRNWGGSTIHLGLGSIIVQAAKQRSGSLRVATADCNVQVKGTVFSVDAGTKGSRVAVVDGTVWVDRGSRRDVLHRGQETATAPDMSPVPIRQEFEWSRNSAQYLALLGEFKELSKEIAAIPPPGLRYESKLLSWLPAEMNVVAAIPNVGDTLRQARTIFHQRLEQSETLAAWWNQLPATQRTRLENTIQQIETASQYLGNEIVIAARIGAGRNAAPVVIAELIRPGLDDFLRTQIVSSGDGAPVMRFDNGLFAAGESAADLARIHQANDFTGTPLYQHLAPAYQRGAGWLFGADLGQMPGHAPNFTGAGFTGAGDARFLVAQSRTSNGTTENRASLTFARDRQGVASWLTAPGPMGSLDFVSPDSTFAASLLLKNPSLIVDDIVGAISKASGGMSTIEQHTGIDIRSELAGAFGGEVTVAMDGPIFPMPSWKIAAEVYYPDRLTASFSKLVTAVNADTAQRERTGDLQLAQTVLDGRTFYSLKFEKLPWEADWTFIDGYWVAAANRELLIRSLQNRQTGYTLPKSAQFRAQLPQDQSTNFSAVIYHNLGQTLAPLIQLMGQQNSPLKDDTPGVICFWAAPDRIDVATKGGLFGMKIESLLAMQGSGPLEMLLGGARSASGNAESAARERRR